MTQKLLIIFLVFLLSGCSMRDYHLGALTETHRSSTSARHINAIKAIDRSENARVCHYPNNSVGYFIAPCS